MTLPMPRAGGAAGVKTAWSELFRYPRSLPVSWLASRRPDRVYGIGLWAPTLFVLQLREAGRAA